MGDDAGGTDPVGRPRHPAPLPAHLRALDRTLVMGVVNVTPDSFSDGGRWLGTDAAVARGERLLADGADLIDVGGESTRPGAARVPLEEELRRVLPVVTGLARTGAVVSVDTTRAAVARAAVERGALIINDVSGGRADPDMGSVAAQTGAVYVAMHWRGPSDRMDQLDVYDDVVSDVVRELGQRVAELRAVGVRDDQLVLDPGLGFAKTGANNWPLLAHLDALLALGHPVLVGASRKRFLGRLVGSRQAGADGPGGPDAPVAPPGERDDATAAVSALAAFAGAWAVRVHEAAASADAVRVAAAWRAARRTGGRDGAQR